MVDGKDLEATSEQIPVLSIEVQICRLGADFGHNKLRRCYRPYRPIASALLVSLKTSYTADRLRKK